MEQIDYDRLDPEERTQLFIALGSAAFGFFSLFAGLLPMCGITFSLVGTLLGYASRKSKYKYIAYFGIGASAVGFLTAIVYGFLVAITQNAQ